MYDHFREMLLDSNVVVQNEQWEEGEGELGRFEFVKACGGMEIRHYFCDMKEYQPDCEIDWPEPCYDDLDSMIKSIVNGDMIEACRKSHFLESNIVKPVIKQKKSLTMRMADVEYPMIHFLDKNNVQFKILNPNKGTLKRMQSIYKGAMKYVVVTCMDEDRFPQYISEIQSVNEYGWPIQQIPFGNLERDLLYYAGFTARKYVGELNVIGYEINPRNLVMTYDGAYVCETRTDSCGKIYDYIEIERAKDYLVQEEYFHEPKYARYEADYLTINMKGKEGWYERPYPLLYNFISTYPFEYFDLKPLEMPALTTIIGYKDALEILASPYDRVIVKNETQDFIIDAGYVAPVVEFRGQEYAGATHIREESPYHKVDPIEYHLNFLKKWYLIEPRKPPPATLYIKKGIICEVAEGARKIGAVEERYYRGKRAFEVWTIYDVDIDDKDIIRELRKRVRFKEYSKLWDECAVEKVKDGKEQSFYVEKRVLKGQCIAYFWDNRFFDENGHYIELYKKVNGTWYLGTRILPEIVQYTMLRAKKGPLAYRNNSYVPVFFSSYNLQKWKDYVKKHRYLHYYTNNEYVLKRNDWLEWDY